MVSTQCKMKTIDGMIGSIYPPACGNMDVISLGSSKMGKLRAASMQENKSMIVQLLSTPRKALHRTTETFSNEFRVWKKVSAVNVWVPIEFR